MNLHCLSHPARHLCALALAAFLAGLTPLAGAAPGAHGPNGEHLDGPAPAQAASALPRLEAASESFELVATLFAGELSVLVDRYVSNEPVLQAQLEVESGGVKARATFHADQGDYAFDDPKLLALLRSPGEHALVFTLVAGAESDLLDGKLLNAAAAAGPVAGGDRGHSHGEGGHDHHALERAAWAGAGGVALVLLGVAFWRRRRAVRTVKLQGVR